MTPQEPEEQKPQQTDQLNDGEINPLNPVGDSLDKLIQLRINDDLWKALLGDLPCLETQEACIRELQNLAVANSRSLRSIDQRVQIINAKIEESRRENKTSINAAVFEPAVTALFKLETITQPGPNGTTIQKQRGFLDRVLGLFTSISGINEILSFIGLPLFKNRFGGGGDAAQQRTILITDLQVKVAEIERQRGELADKIREAVLMQVLEFDVIRKDFQVSQEVARRSIIRSRLREVDYRFTTAYSTDSYLSSIDQTDRIKADSYRQWARLRSQLSRIKILVLEKVD